MNTAASEMHALASEAELLPAPLATSGDDEPIVRSAALGEVDAIHRLISEHLSEGRLLPRTRDDIARHITRFIVAEREDRIVGCADLAPLSRQVAEVRSLVVGRGARSCGTGRRIVHELERRALATGFETLTAFTHAPAYFVHIGFSIVPHVWVPEKIEADCRSCVHFRQCGQYAVMLPLVRTPMLRVLQAAHA